MQLLFGYADNARFRPTEAAICFHYLVHMHVLQRETLPHIGIDQLILDESANK